jgi:hypothetical protein
MGNSGFCLLILTSQMETSSGEIFEFLCYFFLQKETVLAFLQERLPFHSQMSRRFGKQFFLFYAQFLDLLG